MVSAFEILVAALTKGGAALQQAFISIIGLIHKNLLKPELSCWLALRCGVISIRAVLSTLNGDDFNSNWGADDLYRLIDCPEYQEMLNEMAVLTDGVDGGLGNLIQIITYSEFDARPKYLRCDDGAVRPIFSLLYEVAANREYARKHWLFRGGYPIYVMCQMLTMDAYEVSKILAVISNIKFYISGSRRDFDLPEDVISKIVTCAEDSFDDDVLLGAVLSLISARRVDSLSGECLLRILKIHYADHIIYDHIFNVSYYSSSEARENGMRILSYVAGVILSATSEYSPQVLTAALTFLAANRRAFSQPLVEREIDLGLIEN
jgi:hypothetical protein